MPRDKKPKKQDPVPADEPDQPGAVTENWASKPESDIYIECAKWYTKIDTAYENRDEADRAIDEYWAIYNAEPDDNRSYIGNSTCYIPVVRDAIGARAKRALRQLFPTKYKHVEAVGTDEQDPQPQLAILEHYIRKTRLKSVCRSMLVAGDVTGQWSCYVDWHSVKRNVSGVVRRNPIMENGDGDALELSDPTSKTDQTEDQEITDEGPDVVDFAIQDLIVLPPTCNDIEKSDLSCLKLRMSKDAIQNMIDKKVFIMPKEGELADWMDDKKGNEAVNPQKKAVHAAGLKTEGTLKYALVYWAQKLVEFEPGKKSLADIYFAGENDVLGIVKAPQWGQKRSVISAPIDRVAGSFVGISRVEPIKFLQWNLNDFWNMGQDSAMYGLLPVIMTDPAKNPNYAMMVMGLAAVWPIDPNSTKFQEFPQLWKDAVGIVGAVEDKINRSLDVNEMMLGRMPQGRKNNAAVGAQQQEQSVAVIDHAERFEEEILNPLMERFFEYDAQYRDDDLEVLQQGEIGVKARIQSISPQQWGERYYFQWTGTSFVMGMQRMQQQIALMNVLRGIPPQQLGGRRLDVGPILDNLVQNVFGPELGPRILIDERAKFSVPAAMEDEMMANHIMVPIHEADEDMQHIQEHQSAAMRAGDHAGLFRGHIEAHMQQLQKKREAAAPPSQGQMGMPGGAGPGVAGQPPRPGAQPAPQRPVQQPAGAIQQDGRG